MAKSQHAHFTCQKCGQPLVLDTSFANLKVEDEAYNELAAPLINSPDALEISTTLEISATSATASGETRFPIEEDSDVVVKCIPPLQRFSSLETGNGFTLIGKPESPGESLGHFMKVRADLFDIISGQSEVDHPLCEECADGLLDLLDQNLRQVDDELKEYNDFYDKLNEGGEEEDEASLGEELKKLELEEAAMILELEKAQKENDQIKEELEKERKTAKELDAKEKQYNKEYNEYKRQLIEYEDAYRSVDNQLRYAKKELENLKKVNVFNTTFHIWHSGHFGTINGFRLGRLPTVQDKQGRPNSTEMNLRTERMDKCEVQVEWHEINAAWGQTVLLLHSLATKLNLTFQKYRLVPYGNHSHIELLADKDKELPLYGSGGFKFFWDTKFDQAMVAFLDCLQQYKVEVEKRLPNVKFPYAMDKGRILDKSNHYSIKIQFNTEEQWTKALKFMLTNLKWALTWASTEYDSPKPIELAEQTVKLSPEHAVRASPEHAVKKLK